MRLLTAVAVLGYVILVSGAAKPESKEASELRQREIRRLISYLNSRSSMTRRSAISGLREFGPEASASIPIILTLLQKAPPRNLEYESTLRGEAVRALAAMGSAAVSPLKGAVAAPDKVYAAGAACALAMIDPKGKVGLPDLIKLLKNRDWIVRRTAAQMVCLLGRRAHVAVPALVVLLDDQEVDCRNWAAKALGKIGPGAKRSVGTLIKRLKDRDDDVRYSSIFALESIGRAASRAVPDLIEVMDSDNVLLADRAAIALGTFGPKAKDAVPSLIEALGRASDETRGPTPGAAMNALGMIGPDAVAAVPALMKKVRANKDMSAAADALGRIGPVGQRAVINLLSDKNPSIRQIGVWAVSSMCPNNEGAVSGLVKILENDEFREDAADALESVGPTANTALTRVLRTGKSDAVRVLAARALAGIGTNDRIGLADLVKFATHKDTAIRELAVDGLGQTEAPNKAVVSCLVRALGDENVRVRRSAASFLANVLYVVTLDYSERTLNKPQSDDKKVLRAWAVRVFANKMAIAPLRKALHDRDAEVKRRAIWALRQFAPWGTAAIPAIVEGLRIDDPLVRKEAASALGWFGPAAKDACTALVVALGDKDPIVRRRAASALSGMGPEAIVAVPALIKVMQDAKEALPTRRYVITILRFLACEHRQNNGEIVNALAELRNDSDIGKFVVEALDEMTRTKR